MHNASPLYENLDFSRSDSEVLVFVTVSVAHEYFSHCVYQLFAALMVCLPHSSYFPPVLSISKVFHVLKYYHGLFVLVYFISHLSGIYLQDWAGGGIICYLNERLSSLENLTRKKHAK